jgi:hypothetical protein
MLLACPAAVEPPDRGARDAGAGATFDAGLLLPPGRTLQRRRLHWLRNSAGGSESQAATALLVQPSGKVVVAGAGEGGKRVRPESRR